MFTKTGLSASNPAEGLVGLVNVVLFLGQELIASGALDKDKLVGRIDNFLNTNSDDPNVPPGAKAVMQLLALGFKGL